MNQSRFEALYNTYIEKTASFREASGFAIYLYLFMYTGLIRPEDFA